MKKRVFELKVITIATFEHTEGDPTSALKETKVELVLPKMLQHSMYFKKDGSPNANGMKNTSAVLLAGLISQLHTQEQMGYIDSPTNIRWMINHLQNGFVSLVKDFQLHDSIDESGTGNLPIEIYLTADRAIEPDDMEVYAFHTSWKDSGNPGGWRAGFAENLEGGGTRFLSAKWQEGEYKTDDTVMPELYFLIKQ